MMLITEPSFQSCLLRISRTFNFNNLEVKIFQRYKENIPTINNQLVREFRLYLADNDIKLKINSMKLETNRKLIL
ncbi:MAG TPA: hypothetical protein VLA74_08165 [Nitrososphaeraceae archaeon]|nr:hypothetical protein [Nitrososphaeraceae archaeon]